MARRHVKLKALGIVPFKAMDHGPTTSFYYRDPDQNVVEIAAPNHAGVADFLLASQTPQYMSNPSGQPIPGQVKRCRAAATTPSFGGERHSEHALLELAELVARLRRLLELEVLRVLEHLLLQRLDLACDLFFGHRFVARLFLCHFHL